MPRNRVRAYARSTSSVRTSATRRRSSGSPISKTRRASKRSCRRTRMEPTPVAAAANAAGQVAAQISVLDLIHQGWYATYPLIFFSVIVLSIVIERIWTLARLGANSTAVTDEVCGLLAKGEFAKASTLVEGRKATSPASRIYAALIPLIRKGDVEEILGFGERRRLDENRVLRRN